MITLDSASADAAAKVAAHDKSASAHVKTAAFGGPIIWTKQGLWQAAAAGRTVTQQFWTPRSYTGMRFVLINYSATPWTVGPMKAAACPQTFLAGNSALLTGAWTSVTFGGASTGEIPAQANGVPGLLISDVTPVVSVPRTDGAGYITQTRIWLPTGTEYCRTPTAAAYTLNTQFGTAFGSAFEADADGSLVTTPSATAPSAPDNNVSHWAVVGVQYYGGANGKTLVALGDSITAGSGSTNASLSDSTLVTFDEDLDWSVLNLGVAGRTSADNYAQIKSYVAAYKPEIIKFYTWSPNDGSSSVNTFRVPFLGACDVIDYCRAAGVVPIICTAPPNEAVWTNAPRIPWWLAHNTAVRELAASASVELLDVALILTGSTTAVEALPGMLADTSHPTDVGYAAIAVRLKEILATL